MRTYQKFLTLALLFTASQVSSQTTYTNPCPLLGPDYPSPNHLASSAAIVQAKNSVAQAISSALEGNVSTLLDNSTSFSLEIYSLQQEQPIFTYHFTSSALTKAGTGVNEVDSNTIYRIGSVSKLLTVYVYLINAGFNNWHDPITKYIPELDAFARNHSGSASSIDFPGFDQITVGSLASHLSGLPRDAALGPASDEALAALGLPKVPSAPGNFCGDPEVVQFPCTRDDFFLNYLSEHPIEFPLATPVYGNAPFYLLQLALENITAQPLPTLFNNTLVASLSLNSTYYSSPPTNASAVIPGNTSVAWWDVDLSYDVAAGGYYTSLNDLRQIGRSILSSSLLPSAVTRQWLKPVTFTSDLNQSVGAPWEILRAPIPRTSHMYTKSGDLTGYSAMFALLPDYGVGFNILAAGSAATPQVRALGDLISVAFVPAVEAEAKAQAAQNYAGTYTDGATNSSITVAVTPTDPGLVVQNWTLGGQDALSLLTKLVSPDPIRQTATVHLYPTGLTSQNGTVESWRAVVEKFPQQYNSGPFSTNCQTWGGIDQLVYGGVGLDEFTFSVEDGKATTVVARALHLTMLKGSSPKLMRKYF